MEGLGYDRAGGVCADEGAVEEARVGWEVGVVDVFEDFVFYAALREYYCDAEDAELGLWLVSVG